MLCFYCNGGLNNWEAGDNPWIEHAVWFPECTFVLEQKGSNFINKARKDKFDQRNIETLLVEKKKSETPALEEEKPALPKDCDSGLSSPTTEDLKAFPKLEEENHKLKDERLCIICYDKERAVVFLPCGHLNTCTNCAPAFNKCPTCRGTITNLVRAYL